MLLDESKQAALQWLQDPVQVTEDNVNNVKHKPC
jgi:hypothetical protein